MALPAKVKAWLSEQRVGVTIKKHPVAYTAQEIAAAQHVSGKQLAKCVLVLTDRGPQLAVLPATQLIDFKKLKQALGVKRVKLAREADIKTAFPDMEVGAMPPVGPLYGVPTVMDRALIEGEQLVCNAGTHTETMAVSTEELIRAVKPKLASFGLAIVSKPVKRPKKQPAQQPKKAAKKTAPARPASTRKASARSKKPRR